MFVHYKNLCLWTTGQWGMEPGELFQTCKMSYETEESPQLNENKFFTYKEQGEFEEGFNSINEEDKRKGFH